MKKYVRVGIPVIAVAFVAVGLLAAWRSGIFVSTQCNGKDSSELYERAAEAIKADDAKKLRAVADEVSREPRFEEDASCLSVLVAANIANDNAIAAYESFKTLDSLPASKQEVAKPLREAGLSTVEVVEDKLKVYESSKADGFNKVFF